MPIATAEQQRTLSRKGAALLRTLGHDQRLLVLDQLRAGECSAHRLAVSAGIDLPTLGPQLDALCAEGIVQRCTNAPTARYRLADPKMHRLIALLFEMRC